MDNTLCNFKDAYIKAIKETPEVIYPQSQWGFFTNLEPMEGAIEVVNELREIHDVFILSRPSVRNPLCYTEKRIWVENHIGLDFCDRLILCAHKNLLMGDYLIDDNPWDFTGKQLLYGQTPYENWDKVREYFL
jgi:5'(3')-deoxyribonucleotidase